MRSHAAVLFACWASMGVAMVRGQTAEVLATYEALSERLVPYTYHMGVDYSSWEGFSHPGELDTNDLGFFEAQLVEECAGECDLMPACDAFLWVGDAGWDGNTTCYLKQVIDMNCTLPPDAHNFTDPRAFFIKQDCDLEVMLDDYDYGMAPSPAGQGPPPFGDYDDDDNDSVEGGEGAQEGGLAPPGDEGGEGGDREGGTPGSAPGALPSAAGLVIMGLLCVAVLP